MGQKKKKKPGKALKMATVGTPSRKKEPPHSELIAPIEAMRRDVKATAIDLNHTEVRFLVDSFYRIQDSRIRTAHQVRALTEDNKGNEAIDWYLRRNEALEKDLESLLKVFAANNLVCQWASSQKGIGHILSVALYGYIDISKAQTAGSIWRYAGLDPSMDWLGKKGATNLVSDITGKDKLTTRHVALIADRVNRTAANINRLVMLQKNSKQFEKEELDAVIDKSYEEEGAVGFSKSDLIKALAKRPWNARLKTICWKLGSSFEKVKNKEDAFYGQILKNRQSYELAKNENGDYAELAEARASTVGKNTVSYKSYSKGKLPDGHLRARYLRYATKIFLSHWHHVAYETHYGVRPPKPYIISVGGHQEYIVPPNWPLDS